MNRIASTPIHSGRVITRHGLSLAATAIMCCVLLAALRVEGHTFLIRSLVAWLAWLAPILLLMAVFRQSMALHADTRTPSDEVPGDLLVAAGCMVLFLVSSAVFHPWFYFLSWIPSAESVWTKLPVFILLLALLTPFLLKGVRHPNFWVTMLVAIMLAGAFYAFMRATGGKALYRDDHPSMMFRFKEISLTFPQLLNYIPYWNAGAVHYAGTASGLNALALMFWPFLYFLPVQDLYTPMLGVIYIVLVPLMAAISLRLMGATWSAAGLAAILAAGVSRHFFLWLLNYGTVGACFASAMVLPVSACLYRVFRLHRTTWRTGLFLIMSSFLLLAWPPAALMAVAVAASLTTTWREWSRRKVVFLSICALGLFVLMWPQIRLLLGDHKEFFGFLLKSGGASREPAGLMLPKGTPAGPFFPTGWRNLMSHLQEFHPALIFIGLGGLFLKPLRDFRGWFVPPLLTLALLTGWGPILKPNLQLGRMAIPLAFMSVAPAALALDYLWRTRRPALATFRAIIPALILITGWNLVSLWKGHGAATYTVMGAKTRELADFIRQQTPEGGRVMFAGASVHGFGDRGHIAMLPLLTGREMMGCDYYHFSPAIVEYKYPPKPFRASSDTMWSFIEAYNVDLVLTQNDLMKKMFRSDPARCREIAAPHQIAAFVPQRTSSLFLKGGGQIDAGFNRLSVRLAAPSDEVVLKYAWVKGLTLDAPSEIYPYPVADGYDLIGVRTHGATSLVIRFSGHQ